MKQIFLVGMGTALAANARLDDSSRYALVNYVTPAGVVFTEMNDAVRQAIHRYVEREYLESTELTVDEVDFRWEQGEPNEVGGFVDQVYHGSDEDPIGMVVVDVRRVHGADDIDEFLAADVEDDDGDDDEDEAHNDALGKYDGLK